MPILFKKSGPLTRIFFKFFSGTFLITWITYPNFSLHTVHGSSMSPALSPHNAETGQRDWILVSRWTFHMKEPHIRLYHEHIQRGDVVALKKPTDPEELAIKRIVGLPGDKIVRIKKQTLSNQKMSQKCGLAVMPKEVVVPTGHVWVEGDNWRDTFDSNDYGAVPIPLIKGKVSGIIWPWGRYGPVSDRDRKMGRRTTVLEGVPPDENDEAWKKFYNYELD